MFDPTGTTAAAVYVLGVGAVTAGAIRAAIRREPLTLESAAERQAREEALREQLRAQSQLDALRRIAEARDEYRAAVRAWSTEAYALAGSDTLAVKRVERIETEALHTWPTADLIDRARNVSHVLADRVRDHVAAQLDEEGGWSA